MVIRLFFGDIRARFREALVAWAVLTASALILALIASPLAWWMGRPDLAILLGFALVAPVSARVLWRALSAEAAVGTTPVGMPSVRTKKHPGVFAPFED